MHFLLVCLYYVKLALRKILPFDYRWMYLGESRFDVYREIYDEIKSTGVSFKRYKRYFGYLGERSVVVVDPRLAQNITARKQFDRRYLTNYVASVSWTHTVFNLPEGEAWKESRRAMNKCAFNSYALSKIFANLALKFDCDNSKESLASLCRSYVDYAFRVCVFGDAEKDKEFDSSRLRQLETASLWSNGSDNTKRDDYFDEYCEMIRRIDIGGVDSFLKFMTSADDLWTSNDAIRNSTLFFFGGYTATSETLIFALYELARRPEQRARCVREPDYLTKVVRETLRKYPPFAANIRICTEDFETRDKFGNSCEFHRGEIVVIPVSGFHRDADAYSNPEQFEPERRTSSYFAPFGVGRRRCLGEKFSYGILEKMLFQILTEYEVTIDEKYFEIDPQKTTKKFTTGLDRRVAANVKLIKRDEKKSP